MYRWLHGDSSGEGGTTLRFAAPQGPSSTRLVLYVVSDDSTAPSSDPAPDPSSSAGLESVPTGVAGVFRYDLIVPPPGDPEIDDEVTIDLRSPDGLPDAQVILRRSTCRISAALVERDHDPVPLADETRAAMLWQGWRRFQEIVVLKRFTSGKSGSDVLAVRPRLCEPFDVPKESVVPGAISASWGSCLLVKTGAVGKVREEWRRFRTFLRDRVHPFMSRSEDLHVVQLGEADSGDRGSDAAPFDSDGPPTRATMIGSFLGGELLRAESLENLVRGRTDVERCRRSISKLFEVTACWYAGSTVAPLRDWSKVLRFDEDGRLLLFGYVDLTDDAQRAEYRAALAWDIPFIQSGHLHDHLLGRGDSRDGLLYRLADWDARYSLIHGDLHTRNALVDEENVWLLDFGHTGVGPTLFDFAKLEIYLRLWCLQLGHRARNLEDASRELETLLLDNLTGSEATVEPVRELADELGADTDDLLKIVRCIGTVRRLALGYTLGSPDARDYLAILYLASLDTLRFAGHDPSLSQNYRVLVSLTWVLEDVLSRMVGLRPYPRNRLPFEPGRLVSRTWLDHDGAPARVRYVLNSDEDHVALGPLAATRGVLQNDNHHLDVLDHTLLVVAYVERLLDDPMWAFSNPAELDARVGDDLRRQGIHLPPFAGVLSPGESPDPGLSTADSSRVAECLGTTLNDGDSRTALKWAALLHDVGKPSTRTVNATGGNRAPVVQFLGHEVYGLQLVRAHFGNLFEECEGIRTAVEYLILEHHDHHNLVNRYVQHPDRLEQLRESLTTLEMPPREYKYLEPYLDVESSPTARFFPLLVLHGYADVLACRGPASTTSVLRVAEIDTLLLALFAAFPAIRERRRANEECDELLRNLDEELGITGPDLGRIKSTLREWLLPERTERLARGETGPSREEVVARARQTATGLGISVAGRA